MRTLAALASEVAGLTSPLTAEHHDALLDFLVRRASLLSYSEFQDMPLVEALRLSSAFAKIVMDDLEKDNPESNQGSRNDDYLFSLMEGQDG